MELSVAIQAKVEVTPSNWNFGFQPTKKTSCSHEAGKLLPRLINRRKDMKAPEEKEEKRMERIARSEKKHRALADWLELVTEVMEIAVAVIVLVGFFISIIPILKEMPSLLDNTNAYSFHVFLEHAFNLVIGIEFVRMLIKHTPGSALGVLLFAIARHMVLDSGSGLELLMSVAAIAGIFVIRKYLYVHSFESKEDTTTFDWIRGEDSAVNHGEDESN